VTFTTSAAYLGSDQLDRPTFGNLGPEMSRRARGLAVWATLRAYGRAGYRSMIERHLALAQRLAAQIDAEPDLERLAASGHARGTVCAEGLPRRRWW
jgi:glutamate/tyrosine decarboxylase-like PLP-dependent enzyme